MSGTSWELLAEGKALWTASSGAGNTINAGLPNITGNFWFYALYKWEMNADGAFNLQDFQNNDYTSTNRYTRMSPKISFSASRSNSIYGNSSTVQPPAIKVYAYKRLS